MQPLGRMINRVATEIRGRTSPHYQNQIAKVNNGDVCVIVNIEDPLVTGKKLLFKKLRYHTGFIGHLKEYSYKHVLNHKPELLVSFGLNSTTSSFAKSCLKINSVPNIWITWCSAEDPRIISSSSLSSPQTRGFIRCCLKSISSI